MNAVVETEPVVERRYERLELRAIDGELHRWGKWIEDHADYQGYPSANILHTFIGGSGGSTPGHRILCLDMPTDIYATHGRVLMLSGDLREAIWAWFVTKMREDGTLIPMHVKAKALAIDEKELRLRVFRAKRRILGLAD